MGLNTVLQVNSVTKVVLGNVGDTTELIAPLQWTLDDQRTWANATGAGGCTVQWPYTHLLAGATVDFDLTALPRSSRALRTSPSPRSGRSPSRPRTATSPTW
ncbi:MAG: hypothetical protein U0790_00185 [Isosphaeraceae bacterium]